MSSDQRRAVWAVIPAAGAGRRMGGDRPKQTLEIHGRTLLEHGLCRLMEHPWVRGAVVVGPNERISRDSSLPADVELLMAEGGPTRATSVFAGLGALADYANREDWVLVHDAARPCLAAADLDHLLSLLVDDPVGGILGVPAADTLKRRASNGTISATLDRSDIWQAQTPQMFRYGMLTDALGEALRAGVSITDEASALEWAGYRPRIVLGSRTNIKVTYPEDLQLAEAILRGQDRRA